MVVSSAAAKHHSAVQLYFSVASTKQALSATLQLLLLSLTADLKVFSIIRCNGIKHDYQQFLLFWFLHDSFFPNCHP